VAFRKNVVRPFFSILIGESTPLDSFRTELRSYDLTNNHASHGRRLLKCLSLVPALLLTSRQYKPLKEKSFSSWYTKVRRKFLPLQSPGHVDRMGDWNH